MHSRYKKNWMTNNFLLLNSEKTEGLIIGPKNHTSNNLEHGLTLDGCSLESSSSVRNLGVLFWRFSTAWYSTVRHGSVRYGSVRVFTAV